MEPEQIMIKLPKDLEDQIRRAAEECSPDFCSPCDINLSLLQSKAALQGSGKEEKS